MVVLNIKRSEQALFLYETKLNCSVDAALQEICILINGRLKLLRICDSLVGLACHGIAKAPKVRGLLEDQVKELKLVDEEVERCEPVGGSDEAADPVEFRVGRCPTGPFKELLIEAAKSVESKLKDPQHFLTQKDITTALKEFREAVAKVYPMGLPEYEPIRMELENRECLSDYNDKQSTNVADPQDTKLWFASKEMLLGKNLSDYLGKNEKTKVIIKVASKKAGQPSREPLLSEQEQRLIMAHQARRREEIQRMAKDQDDSYLDAKWADQQGLKRKVIGLENVSWKPF